MKTHLELDLGRYFGEDPIEEVIAARAAHQLLQNETREESTADFRRRVRSITDDMIREKLEPLVAEALSGGIQPTNRFGEAKGEPITLREYIVEFVKKHSADPSRDSWGDRRRGETLVQMLIRTEMEQAFKKELSATMKAATEAAKKVVQDEAASVIRQAIERAGARLG